MNKKFASYLLSVLFLISCFLFIPKNIFAQSIECISDPNQHLDQSQWPALQEKATAIQKINQAKVYFLITDEATDDVEYAAQKALFQRVGKDGNGAIAYIDLTNRNFTVVTSGNMIDYLTDRRIDDLIEAIKEPLSADDYNQAAKVFFDDTYTYVKKGIPHGHYRINKDTGEITYYKSLTGFEIAISLVIGGIAAIACFFTIMGKYQLRFGSGYHYDTHENGKMSFEINETRLINRFVTTRVIPKHTNDSNSDSGGSSFGSGYGGGSYGGGGSHSF